MRIKNIQFFRIIVLVVLFLFSKEIQAQTGVEVLKKVSSHYSGEYFSYKSQYKLYESYTIKTAKETYSGTIIKNKDNLYVRIKDIEMVTFSNLGIKVDPTSKTIALNKKDQLVFLNPLDTDKYLKDFNVKIIENKADYYLCELTTKSAISMYMVDKILFYVDKKDHHIKKQIIYTVNDIYVNDKGKSKKIRPRIEIEFTPSTSDKKQEDLLFKKENYIKEQAGQITPASRYKGYKLIQS